MQEPLQVNLPTTKLEIKIVLPIWFGGSGLAFARTIFHSCVGRHPVHFPRLAPISGERLFKTARIRGDVCYDESNQDSSTMNGFLVKKLATSILELADRGLAKCTVVAIGKIEAPLAGLGIIETQVQAFEMPFRAVGLKFHKIGAAIPNFSDDACTVIFKPSRRS